MNLLRSYAECGSNQNNDEDNNIVATKFETSASNVKEELENHFEEIQQQQQQK